MEGSTALCVALSAGVVWMSFIVVMYHRSDSTADSALYLRVRGRCVLRRIEFSLVQENPPRHAL